MVQACLSDAPHRAFADGIGSWGMIRRFQYLDTARCRHARETGPKLAIVITNQVLRHLAIRSRFPELLPHPGIRRRSCDANMDDLACLEEGEEEGKERSKEQIGHLQEVTGPDLPCMGAQKGRPRLASWRLCANRPHVLLNGSLADRDAQFQSCSPNPFSTPKSIVPRHLSNQGNRFHGDLRLVRSGL